MCAGCGAHRFSGFCPTKQADCAASARLGFDFFPAVLQLRAVGLLGGMGLHRRSAEETVRQFLKVWASSDVEAAACFIAEDCIYALYISREALPFAGETVGKAAIVAALRIMRSQFDYVLYRPHRYISEGGNVRLRVEHMYRHRASGEVLSGNFSLIFEVRDNLIVRADEYHDRAMVEAFIRLVSEQARPAHERG